MSLECKFCKSNECVKRGKRRNKSSVKQRYICKACGRQFIESDGFEKMRHKPKVIVRAIHMHNDGMSLSTVQNHLWQHDNVRVTGRAISQWHKKYSNFLKSVAQASQAYDKRKNTRR